MRNSKIPNSTSNEGTKLNMDYETLSKLMPAYIKWLGETHLQDTALNYLKFIKDNQSLVHTILTTKETKTK